MSTPSFDEAAALAQEALRLQSEGDPAMAIDLYRKTFPTLAAVPEIHNNLAVCHFNLGDLEEAETALRTALRLRPAYAEAHSNLGNTLKGQGRTREAVGHYREALRLSPDYAWAHFNLGTCLLDEHLPVEAESELRTALQGLPKAAKVWRNFSLAQLEQGNMPGALEAIDRAFALDPNDAEVRCNRALARLLCGDFQVGWEEYEWRWRLPDNTPLRYPIPRWQGEELKGKRILLWTEQGAGTAIQFIRYAPLFAARGAEVIVACSESLRRLFESARGVSAVVSREEIGAAAVRECDYELPMMSAAFRLGTTEKTIPPPERFFLPDEEGDGLGMDEDEEEGKPVPQKPRPLRVGLAWAGNPAHANDRLRSMPLEALHPLAALPGIEWVSLQKGDPAVVGPALARWPVPRHGGSGIRDAGSGFSDFYETAVAMEEIDFVLSVDTAVAHLAGSLGKPTALFLPFCPDWRWMLRREETPWYPSVRLLRQPRLGPGTPGAWEEPVLAAAGLLRDAVILKSRRR